ncbi:uncharacterized protein LOC131674318 [Phymastichus coffea]|uniref:uncharacterized protein LOC131674318 n=1 Tax=Phymastichus coffea TaxID=108790 RepID=UPI00273B9E89|nr:uncharacterized protein LOC131674318 [Phymastichus coffea]
MADLPEPKVSQSAAFSHTGVDFFGPINIKEKAHKNRSFLKAYGCVFICLASKAVHIELATDLSTPGFLSTFRRFIARRGLPAHVYSNNRSNFVGACKELNDIFKFFNSEDTQRSLTEYAISKRIEWHFNPPLSPHFGDPNDPLAITPAHLLIGRPLNALPEESLLSVPDNRLSTYKFLSKARQNFWNKWHQEYLHELQVRQKWNQSTSELKPGVVVLLIEDNVPCGKWPLGVILEVFPGSDHIARVASVKTASGTYKRNITRLCILPIL